MDYSRPPPPQPARTIAGRIGTRNLRPVVLFVTTFAALFSLFAAIGEFKALGSDGNKTLNTISIALGACYIAISFLEAFGAFAAVTQRLPLIRLYTFASVASGVLIVAASLTGTVVHFVLKKDLLADCTDGVEGLVVRYRYGWFGPRSSEVLDAAGAKIWCDRAWDRGSWSEILSSISLICLSVFMASIAFAYYRQSQDPAHPSNSWRDAPQYNASYNMPNLGYNNNGQQPQQQSYAAPAGPPPNAPPPFSTSYNGHDDDTKPPGYQRGDGGFGGYSKDKDGVDDPFGDFDGPAGRRSVAENRAGQDRFV